MRRYKKFLFIGMVLIHIVNGCKINEDLTESIKDNGSEVITTPEPTKNSEPVNKEYYGYWVYIEDGSYEKIDKDYAYQIKPFGENLIKINRNGNEYILLRKGSNKASVSGQVYSDINTLEKLNQENQKKMTYYIPTFKKRESNNLYITFDDGFVRHREKIEDDGSFYISGIQWFGEYSNMKDNTFNKELLGNCTTAKKRCQNDGDTALEETNEKNETTTISESNISLPSEDSNLGNFYIPDKNDEYNFKTTKIVNDKDKDDRYMYENRIYKGTLIFKNTGEKTAEGLNFTIKTDDLYVDNLENEDILGSVEANQSKEVPFKITFRRLDKIKHTVKLDFIIRDAHGKEWLDNVYLDVYQTPITVNIKTKSSKLKGYFITPEHDILNIETKDIAVKIPRRPDGKYFFVVSTPKTLGEETAYSIGVDVDAPDFENFRDTSAYEPNDNEATATKLKMGDAIKSYVHKGDIDFYTIEFKSNLSFTPPALPFK